jgi:poly(3-hydroxybutyrate) depolymerase
MVKKYGARAVVKRKNRELFKFPEVGVPFLWPFALFMGYEEAEIEAVRDNLKFLKEVEKTQIEKPKPMWATKNKVRLDLHTLKMREFSWQGDDVCTFIVAPYAGHTSTIIDFHKKQSLVEILIENGIGKVCATDWKSATEEMKYFDIDIYMSELNVCVDELGGSVNLAGMCQGGWLSLMYAARFPHKVHALVLGGSPIDTDAGTGAIKDYAHKYPMEFFEELVVAGGGVLKGDYMLEGFKSLHPETQFFDKYMELYEHIDDPEYVRRFENFERWYEYTIDLPGKFYLQVVKELFKENRLFKGEFIGLGKKLNLKDVKCPVYLLAGESDDITPKEQVFNAEKILGTDRNSIIKDTASGGHIGLFMGSKSLRENWPKIVKWLKSHAGR